MEIHLWENTMIYHLFFCLRWKKTVIPRLLYNCQVKMRQWHGKSVLKCFTRWENPWRKMVVSPANLELKKKHHSYIIRRKALQAFCWHALGIFWRKPTRNNIFPSCLQTLTFGEHISRYLYTNFYPSSPYFVRGVMHVWSSLVFSTSKPKESGLWYLCILCY